MMSATPDSALDTGHLAFAVAPSSAIFSAGTSASTTLVRAMPVIVGPSPVTAIDTLAVVSIEVGGVPSSLRSSARNCEKQPACAAPISSSGFVPAPSANREALVKVPSIPEPVAIVPVPSSIDPCHCAVPVAAMGQSFVVGPGRGSAGVVLPFTIGRIRTRAFSELVSRAESPVADRRPVTQGECGTRSTSVQAAQLPSVRGLPSRRHGCQRSP